jgi:competence protein ComEA
MDCHELLLCGALILVIVAGIAVRQIRSAPDAEPVLLEAPGSFPPGVASAAASAEPLASLSPHAASLSSGLKDINLASAIELQQVSGIGPSLSRNILEYRDAQGPFQTMDELLEVSGIGAERLKRLKEQFTVGELAIPPRPEAVESDSITGSASLRPQIEESRIAGSNKIDLNTATARELESLPGVGPVLAEAIVAYRERRGPFQSIEQLQEVSGFGPKRYDQVAPLVVAGGAEASEPPPRLNLPDAPTGFPSSTAPVSSDKFADGRTRIVNLNEASAEQLESLPGIGEVLARRIVEYRNLRGGFRSPEELKNVSGIGEKKYAQIRPLIEVP